MEFELKKPSELDEKEIKIWNGIQRSNARYWNPYFSIDYIKAVASVRHDVYIGILQIEGKTVGFFPHQRKNGIARPVGLGLSDYHGILIDSDVNWSSKSLLKGLGLIRWEFDHLLASQTPFLDNHSVLYESPIIRIENGFEQYFGSLNGSGRKQIKEIQRKERKFSEQIGSVKYTQHTDSTEILNTLIKWKSDQCKRTGTYDYFSLDWCRNLIHAIHENPSDDFGGMLSCLHVDRQLAAIHFGMRYQTVLHSWFPTYNHKYEAYSPGSILLLKIVESAATTGFSYIDLGKGMSVYKKKMMNDCISIAEGVTKLPCLKNQLDNVARIMRRDSQNILIKTMTYVPRKIMNNRNRIRRYN